MKSNAEHLANYCCPCCGSENLEGGAIDIRGQSAVQMVDCLDCFAEWQDEYHLKRYTLFSEGEEKSA
jgi:hypothetical protein